MIRRFNYTNRKKINRDHATPHVRRQSGLPDTFRVALDLGSYGFPPSALVFAEAYRQTNWKRFSLGTVGAPPDGDWIELSPPGASEGFRFRIRVTSPDKPHVLLGEADSVRAEVTDDGRISRQPLLPVRPDDLGAQVWKLDLDPPVLAVHRRLDWRMVARDKTFVALVYPNALRTVLEALGREADFPDFDGGWQHEWMRFARALSNSTPPDGDADAIQIWIDDVVESFARNHQLLTKFAAYWRETAE
jgi:hypothetical protein